VRLAGRIGAYDLQPFVASHAPVPNTGGQYEHVAGLEPEQAPALASQFYGHLSFRDAEYFMRIRMEVRVVINGIGPETGPAALLERFPEPLALPPVFGARIPRNSRAGSVLLGTSFAFSK
jgi:hypothetical protein